MTTSSTYNAWKLVSLSPLPPWALLALGTGLALGVALALLGLRKEPLPGRRAVLWALRILSGVAALFFVLEPGIRHMQVATVKNRVAILVDRSASMGFPADAEGHSRAQVVARYLESVGPDLTALAERFTLEVYGFDPQLAPLTTQALNTEPPRGGHTDLLSALRAVKASDQGGSSRKRLSGVLLFSDGADNTELQQGVAGGARAALSDLEVPVSTFVVGRDALKDLAVETVKVDDFAFVRNAITVEVEVRGRGFGGQTVPVVLRREGQVVAQKDIRLESGDEQRPVSFQLTPDQTGRFVYTVEVPVFPEEAVADNNSRSFVLKVIRDRVRVLLVVGRPTWDERFLRGRLRQDPNVDLVSFYILRTMSDDPNVVNPDRELSLIPFPMEEIFRTKLRTFDVVIFQNFGYTDPSLSIMQYEDDLERYIRDGGGFMMIGGDRSFGEGRVTFPILGRAFPLEASGLPASSVPFRPRLTPDGSRHPITAVQSGASASEASWASMPDIPGANVTRAREGATVLLDHPELQVDGRPAPLLAVWEYERGRVAALALDASWYWAFTSHREGSPTRHYDRFWGNVLRWLVRDPDLTTLKVTADPPTVEPGKPVGVVVVARMPDYQPAADAEVKVDLVSVSTQKVVASQVGLTGPDGTVRVELPPPAPGPYRVVGTARKGERDLGEGEDAVAVRAVGRELSDAAVRPELMERIASLTSGKDFRLPMSGLPDLPLLDPPVVEVGRSKDQPLWDRWYYLVALVALLGTEWFLRRRYGHV